MGPTSDLSLYSARLKVKNPLLRAPPLALSTISLIYDSHFLAYVPKVDVKSSLSALTLVVPRRAECINEQVDLGK